MDVIATVPNVPYICYTKKGEKIEVHNPSGLPAPAHIDYIEEPYIKAQIISRTEYIGSIMKLCIDKRGELLSQIYLTGNRVEVTFECHVEIVFDIYE
jgi:GTP-binding protein LepA